MFRRPGAFTAMIAVAALGMACDRLLGLDGGDEDRDQVVMNEKPIGADAAPEMDASSAIESPPPTPCESYCDQVTTTCTSTNQVYANKQECLGFCEILLAPAPKDLSCRSEALQLRADDSLDSCMKAGPGGFSPKLSECETGPCGSYCTLMAGLCPDYDLHFGTVTGATAKKSHEDCVAECKLTFESTEGYTWSDTRWSNAQAAMDNPGVGCRIYHLGLALEARDTDKADLLHLHCQHAAGEFLCGPPIGADAGSHDH